MSLSKSAVGTLVDLVENKLATLQIGDRNDLREMVTLQRCLSELKGINLADASDKEPFDIPHRGRHRKVTDLMQDLMAEQEQQRERA